MSLLTEITARMAQSIKGRGNRACPFCQSMTHTKTQLQAEIGRYRSALDEIGYASWPGDDAIARIKALARASLHSQESAK